MLLFIKNLRSYNTEIPNVYLMPWRRDHKHEKETLDSITENIDYMFCHTETRGVQTSPSTKHLHEGGNDVGQPLRDLNEFTQAISIIGKINRILY